MEKFNDKDNFLAKWASGDLSEIEKETFRKTKEYNYYKAILDGTDLLEIPTYDGDKIFNSVQKKITSEKKLLPFISRWIYVAAASVAILIGSLFFFNDTVNYETGYGEQLTILLPDNSEVILNAKSKLRYKKNNWEEKRILTLEGEAYFKVNKGAAFTVATGNGSVTVLGTKFTVNSGADIFEVICYEGKVNVETADFSKIIMKGEATRVVNKFFESWVLEKYSPSWLKNESSFTNAPLSQVIKALEKHYNLTINSKSIDTSLRFTGSFTHYNVETALSTVFESMEMKFTFHNKRTINLVKK